MNQLYFVNKVLTTMKLLGVMNQIKVFSVSLSAGRLCSVTQRSVQFPVRGMSSKFVDRMRLQQRIKVTGILDPDQFGNGQYLVYVREGGLVMVSSRSNQLAYADFQGLKQLESDVEQSAMFMNIDEGGSCRFALEFPSLTPRQLQGLERQYDATFVSLRQSLFLLPARQSNIVSQGKSLLRWRRTRNFCPECGSSVEAAAGWAHKVCGSCAAPQYPQMSPVSIALVEDEAHQRALLVRQPRHPKGMFSCLAGFVDLGESVEESVAREVAEEVGLALSNTAYLTSQHWPHPAPRLMLGCIATALPGEVEIDRDELEAAAWFTPDVLRAALCSKSNPQKLWLPPPGALAHHLIAWWLSKYHSGS